MVRNPLADDETPELTAVLDALDDEDCREIVSVYEGVDVRSDGQHTSRYMIDFEEVVIALSESREFEVDIAHRARSPDQRLENLWSEVRKET